MTDKDININLGALETARHPHLPFRIAFDSRRHEYRMQEIDEATNQPRESYADAPVFLSATQFIGNYFPHFDADAVAAKAAPRRGTTPEALKAQWAKESADACDLGSRVHENQEYMMTRRTPPHKASSEREREIMTAGWMALKHLTKEGWQPFSAELKIFAPLYHLAGTVDAIFQRGRDILIADWKTNKAIHSASEYGDKCLAPIAHLDACELTKYTLQLSLYRRILQHEEYIKRSVHTELAIIHLTPAGFQIIPVKEMKLEIAAILFDRCVEHQEEMYRGKIPF